MGGVEYQGGPSERYPASTLPSPAMKRAVPLALGLTILAGAAADGQLGRWLFAVVVVDLASLVIDFVDVGRYLVGDRQPAPGTAPGTAP